MEQEIAKVWFKGFNNRDWSSMERLYSEDALFHTLDGQKSGADEVTRLGKKWTKAFPDAQITPVHISNEGADTLVVHWRAHGTFEAPIYDMEPSGKEVAFHGLTCFRQQDGKIVEHWATTDLRPLKQ